MGITFNYAALLAKAKQMNVCFDKTLTIGHQTLFLSPQQIDQLAKLCNLNIETHEFLCSGFADKFFEKFLDAKSVKSLDCSDYENSTIIHDMNRPIDSVHHRQYDVVIDGGSLEHIFNFPVAVGNCMNLLKEGGSLFIYTTCNNHAGHGFYQFSPEVFFRIFQPANGFKIQDVVIEKHPYPGAELSSSTKCYSVIDPAIVKRRVGLVSKYPTMIMVHAIKVGADLPFAEYPIQSDYASIHAEYSDEKPNEKPTTSGVMLNSARKLFDRLPVRLQNFVVGRYQLLNYSSLNRRFYKKWTPF